ncbi:MAG: hypothetical protein J6F30_02760 [Cellulosilyticum sp.]|nr:hypothetical protein [Cellulosilyticum sp.]
MNSDLNYQVLELNMNGSPALHTIGLADLIGVEFCMQLVIDKPLARGLITQIVKHYMPLVDQPSLFNDPWIQYVFKENHTLALLPFVLLKEEHVCHIIIPDEKGLYPWQIGCQQTFIHQVDEPLMIHNLLIAIKSCYLTQLMLEVATNVYQQIGFDIHLEDTMPLEDIPDDLADKNLDMYIVLTLCFNKTMPELNDMILSSCHSIALNIMTLPNPLAKAHEIASRIYQPLLVEKYITLIMQTFQKLNERL